MNVLKKKLNKLKRIFSENLKTIGSVIVVAALLIACLATVIERNTTRTDEMGRLIAITPLYDEPVMAPRYDKIAYTTIADSKAAKRAENSQGIRDSVGAYSGNKKLTEQQQKDKAALEALLASNTRGTAGDYAKDRNEKYKVNQIKEVNDNISVSFTPNSSFGNSGVGSAVFTSSNGSYQGQFLLTGYCPCAICCGKTNGITASGSLATSNHTIAADRRYAFGTQLVINGQVYTVEDRGGAIQGNHIDVFFNTHAEALAFGRQYADVYLYTGEASSSGSDSSSDSSSDSNEDGGE